MNSVIDWVCAGVPTRRWLTRRFSTKKRVSTDTRSVGEVRAGPACRYLSLPEDGERHGQAVARREAIGSITSSIYLIGMARAIPIHSSRTLETSMAEDETISSLVVLSCELSKYAKGNTI